MVAFSCTIRTNPVINVLFPANFTMFDHLIVVSGVWVGYRMYHANKKWMHQLWAHLCSSFSGENLPLLTKQQQIDDIKEDIYDTSIMASWLFGSTYVSPMADTYSTITLLCGIVGCFSVDLFQIGANWIRSTSLAKFVGDHPFMNSIRMYLQNGKKWMYDHRYGILGGIFVVGLMYGVRGYTTSRMTVSTHVR